jgi:hypothetical protein
MWLVEGRGLPPARQARPSQSRTLGRANGSLVISRGRAGSSTPALRLLGYRLVLTQLRDQRGTSGGASTSRQLKEERASAGARAPQSPLGSDPDPPVGDADPARLLMSQLRDERPRSDPSLHLAHHEPEAEARHLATPLLLDPRPLVRENTVDPRPARPPGNNKPGRPSPRNLQPPPPRPMRPPDLDSLHRSRD